MIIVFVGSIGSGKSTGADILKRKFIKMQHANKQG